MRLNVFIGLPATGWRCFDYSRPPSGLEIREVPAHISDDDLRAMVAGLCATAQGFLLPKPENSKYSINYKVLASMALRAGLPVPPEPARPAGRRG